MSESEIPIDQNATGGEPLPNEENEDAVEETGLALAQVNIDDDGGDGGDGGDENTEEDDNGHDDDDDDDDDDGDDDDSDDSEDEDFMAELPSIVRHRVEKMKELNGKRDEIMEDYLKERAALEKKFADLCNPLYDERAKIIRGERDEDIAVTAKSDKEDENVKKSDGDEDSDEEEDGNENLIGVPEFWSCCIQNIEVVSELVTEQDNDCLIHLENVTCHDFEDGKGFELKFHFNKDNPYFSNEILTKRYEIPNLLLDDEPILKNVTGCDIEWKANMCLTFREVKKKQRSKSGKRAGQIRTVTKKERADSFFHFFSPPKIPNMHEMNEDEADAIEEAFDHDYDVAQSFRSHIIPKAVMWFTGEAMHDNIEQMMGGTAEALLSQLQGNQTIESPFPQATNGSEEPECKQS